MASVFKDPIFNLDRMREIRKYEVRVTLQQVADELGVTRSQVWGYETGRSIPSVPRLLKLLKFYKIKLEDILLPN